MPKRLAPLVFHEISSKVDSCLGTQQAPQLFYSNMTIPRTALLSFVSAVSPCRCDISKFFSVIDRLPRLSQAYQSRISLTSLESEGQWRRAAEIYQVAKKSGLMSRFWFFFSNSWIWSLGFQPFGMLSCPTHMQKEVCFVGGMSGVSPELQF